MAASKLLSPRLNVRSSIWLNLGGHKFISSWFSTSTFFFRRPKRFFFFFTDSWIVSGGGRPIPDSDVLINDCSLLISSAGERTSILSADADETPSGVVAENDDNDEEEVLRLSSVVRDGNDDAVGERCAIYFDGWNELIGKRTARDDFIQRLFDNWKRLMWKI